jgi:hypothetical protein
MNQWRKIPRKLIIDGDVELGKTFVSLADSELRKLEHDMKFQSLQQLSRTRKFGNVVIECWVGFGLSTVRITTAAARGGKKKSCYECMCGCHVSVGVVAFPGPTSCLYHILDLQYTYDVIVCQKKTKYIELSGCQPTDFTRFANGDLVYVLWVPDAPFTYADNMRGGCLMETSSWGRILPFVPGNAKFDEKPC